MKKFISVIIFLSLALAVYAQDVRQRTVETVVADVLAAMPAQNSSDFNSQIGDLAAAAPASVVQVAAMMKPAAAGVKNSIFEYALSGLSSYASANPKYSDNVREGFAQAIEATSDKTNKAFLMTQLRPLAKIQNAPLYQKYVSDPDLASTAMGALVDIPGTDDIILGLIKEGKVDKSLLAASAARKGLKSAEPYLQNWASTSTGAELEAVCFALGKVGTASSLNILKDKSTSAYAALAARLADGTNSKAVAKAAKSLMESNVSAYKSAGAEALIRNNPAKAYKTVAAALNSEDGQYRDAVIDDATEVLGASTLIPLFTKKYSKLSDGAKVDILNWFGNNKIASASNLVTSAFSGEGEIAKAAITAAGKIGGGNAAKALIAQLGGSNKEAAYTALKSFKGDIQDDVNEALKEQLGKVSELKKPADMQSLIGLLNLANSMNMKKVAPTVYSLIGTSSQTVSSLASLALKGVVGTGDIAKVGALLDKSNNPYAFQTALISAIHTLSPDEQYSQVSNLMKSASNVANFYPVLASTGTDKAVEDLSNAFSNGGGKAAFEALLKTGNYKAAPVLMAIAKNNPEYSELAVNGFGNLVSKFETDPDAKVAKIAEGLSLAKTPVTKEGLINILGSIPTMKSFLNASKYLDDSDVKINAAEAVRKIASSTKEEIDYSAFKTSLTKAAAIYKARNFADDEYAVKEIDKMISEAQPSPVSELTAEEKKQGFEMLFDGTNLDKWQGDKDGYIPVNGTIYVTANYGSTGNLYTKKEYRNFVYRFEFCFLREGVNNGVGVRTPMGVDAAYDGMCEVQILDHDAPMYANLHEYQVHGSVYGVIPAKRIVHKPLGEWSTEEIRVVGDNIKVTVNGQVIVDGNVRKACKGHNVAPDGSNNNPYTVDHRNHPGMFNKKGYISFCGHGEGLKIRNVRVLDLGD